MNPGETHHLVGKYTVKASFGTVTYGPARRLTKGTPLARVLCIPDDKHGADLADWLEIYADAIRARDTPAHDARKASAGEKPC